MTAVSSHDLNERAWTTIDKSEWGDGPWQDEPDKIVWIDARTGLDCMIHRHDRLGHLCGYVGVPPGHPDHGVECADLVELDVHYGVNFTALCNPAATEEWGLCHVPLDPSRPHDVWWIGFDCAHAFDLTPKLQADLGRLAQQRDVDLGLADLMKLDPPWRPTYRGVAYVRAEVRKLAAQLAERG